METAQPPLSGQPRVATTTRHSRAIRTLSVARLAVAYAILIAGSVVSMVPLVWMLSTSFKEPGLEFEVPIRWFPSPFTPVNYVQIVHDTFFPIYTRNSAIVTGLSTVGSLLSSSLVAYGFARLRFRGRDFWFMVLISTMLLPGIVTLIPRFILFRTLGWYNTWLPLIVPEWFASAFYVFLIRQFYLTLPYELEEAARVD